MKKIEMFKDQLPGLPRYINKPFPSAKPHLAKHAPVRPIPAHEDESKTEAWGLTFALNHDPKESGRKPGSASWEGIANLFWWADRESGVGGMIASQILPYGGKSPAPCVFEGKEANANGIDVAVLDVNDAAEKLVYTGLNRTEDMYK